MRQFLARNDVRSRRTKRNNEKAREVEEGHSGEDLMNIERQIREVRRALHEMGGGNVGAIDSFVQSKTDALGDTTRSICPERHENRKRKTWVAGDLNKDK